MRRLLLFLALALVVLGLLAAPSFAFYAPAHNTAYIDGSFQAKGWIELVGPDYEMVLHQNLAIPQGWPVVVATSWADALQGTNSIAAHEFIAASFSRVGGGWSFSIDQKDAARYWSPAYQWDPVSLPGLWASDCWIPMGVLPAGSYTGTFHTWSERPFPTWADENGELLGSPVMMPVFDYSLDHTFKVR